MNLLAGKIAVVTGAGSGIGKSIALHYVSEGATVVVADVNAGAAQSVVEELRSLAPASMAIQVDVTSKESCQALYHTVVERFGRVDIAGNNAGVSSMNRIVDLTEEEWDFNMSVNAKGVFLCTQAVLPYMMQQGEGCIINTASMAGMRGTPLLAHYAASKWAVIGFTKSAALEVAEHGIRVNCVCPGYVKTSMQEREVVWEAKLRGLQPEEVFAEYIRQTPLKRIQTADDVAHIYVFLASHLAEFVTGEAIDVTGGANLV